MHHIISQLKKLKALTGLDLKAKPATGAGFSGSTLEVPSGLPRIQNDIENELVIQIFKKD